MVNYYVVLLILSIAAIANTAGNFLYQKLSRQNDWRIAIERTWFQLIALLTVGINYAIFLWVFHLTNASNDVEW